MSWPQIQKNCHFEVSSSFILATTTNNFLIGLWQATKSGFHMITDDNQLSGWTKKKLQSTSQSQTCSPKWLRSLFGGLLPIWSTTAFWILVKPLPLKSMLNKSMWCTENCTTYSWLWSTERAQFSMTMSYRMSHNQLFKSWTKTVAWKHIHYRM